MAAVGEVQDEAVLLACKKTTTFSKYCLAHQITKPNLTLVIPSPNSSALLSDRGDTFNNTLMEKGVDQEEAVRAAALLVRHTVGVYQPRTLTYAQATPNALRVQPG